MSNEEALSFARKVRYDFPDVTLELQEDGNWTIDYGKQKILSKDVNNFYHLWGYLEGKNAVMAA